jgi:ribosome-associated protein
MSQLNGETSGDQIVIMPELSIPLTELRFRFSRSGGPGGQHVNRTETRVELLFDVAQSPSLTEEQRQHVLARLGSQVDSEGVLHIVSSLTRSQYDNRADTITRFQALLGRALHRPRRRIATRPGRAAAERRLQAKRQHSQHKQTRRRVDMDE